MIARPHMHTICIAGTDRTGIMSRMKVSLLIPTRNEEGCIGRGLAEVPRELIDEIVIVDGHSTDKTMEEARAHLQSTDQLLTQNGKGFGNAMIEALQAADGDILLIMDADGSHNPADIPAILEKIHAGYEYVMGSRYMKGAHSLDDTVIRRFGNHMFTWLINVLYGTRVTDALYLYTAITREGYNKLTLTSQGFEFCTEILIKAHRAGLKFAEVPAIERSRFAGETKVNAFWHGLKILRMILKQYWE